MGKTKTNARKCYWDSRGEQKRQQLAQGHHPGGPASYGNAMNMVINRATTTLSELVHL